MVFEQLRCRAPRARVRGRSRRFARAAQTAKAKTPFYSTTRLCLGTLCVAWRALASEQWLRG